MPLGLLSANLVRIVARIWSFGPIHDSIMTRLNLDFQNLARMAARIWRDKDIFNFFQNSCYFSTPLKDKPDLA